MSRTCTALLLLAAAVALPVRTTSQAPATPSAVGPRTIVGANVRASNNLTTGGRNECWVAVSPTNPDFVVGVAQSSAEGNPTTGPRRCSTQISRSGGETWREINLPGQEEGCFDPMQAFGVDGRLYVMHTMMGRNMGAEIAGNETRRTGEIRVWASSDEGRTWEGPAKLECPLAPDHPRLVVDRTNGPYRGRVYVAWNEVSDTLLKLKYHVFLHYSEDGGKTFSDPKLLISDDGGKLVATEPVVLSDGTLLVTYYQYYWPLSSPKNDRQPVYILRSTDGGQTFGPPEKIFDAGSSSWRHLRGDFGRAFTLPIFVADMGSSSRFRDRIYAVWDDVSAGQSNIWLVSSSDKGRTWSAPRRVNDNPPPVPGTPPDYRMTPVVAVNNDGVVGIAWYDRRDDPSRRCWRYYFSASLDGGDTFTPNTPISSAASCPDKDVAPTVRVWNTSDEIEDTLPTRQELEKMKLTMERRQLEEEIGVAAAWREAAGKADASRIRVAFDKGRNVWPGHYSGLDAVSDGGFQAFWADRRNAVQQLFAARVDVTLVADPPVPMTEVALVTDRIQVIGGPAKVDDAKGTVGFEIQLRNVSDRPIYAPIRLRVAKIGKLGTAPTLAVIEPDGGGLAAGAWWDFTKHLGTRGRLDPKKVSEARTITIKTKPATGLDGVFDFEVLGGVEKRPTTTNDRAALPKVKP
jgi:hypothetical protein